jgi:hypothetical protein
MKPEIIIYCDRIEIADTLVPRPAYMSVKQWLDFWEDTTRGNYNKGYDTGYDDGYYDCSSKDGGA